MTEPTPAPTVDASTTAEYAEGRQAFLDDKPDSVCPYGGQGKGNNERYRWFAGWLAAKYEQFEPYELRERR